MGKGAPSSAGLRSRKDLERLWNQLSSFCYLNHEHAGRLQENPTLHCHSSTLLLSPSQCSKTHQLADQLVDSINSEISISVNTSGGHLWCSYTCLPQANPPNVRKVLRKLTRKPFNVKGCCHDHLAKSVSYLVL